MKELLAGNKSDKKPSQKKKPEEPQMEEKKLKGIRMPLSTISLLNKVTFYMKAEDEKVTFAEAIHEGLNLLAKKKGIDIG